MDEGYAILDIGLDNSKKRIDRGAFYAMELNEIIVERSYQRYFPILGGF